MKRDWLLTAALALAAATLACGEQPAQPAASTEREQSAAASPAPTAAAQPSSQPLEPEVLSVLSVEHQVDVLAEGEGTVVEVASDEGSRVSAGALLARLDDREVQAKLERAQADLEIARTNVKYNEAELQAREAAHRRAQEMRELGLNSDADLEEAEFRAKASRYDMESWQRMVERNQAELRLLEVELERTRIQAPFSGVVARRYLRLGQNIKKGDPCFQLSQLGPLQVRFLVSESRQPPGPGAVVNVTPVADSQRVYAARVLRISPTVDAASGSYDVTAQLMGNDLDDLRPGMSVRVSWKKSASTP